MVTNGSKHEHYLIPVHLFLLSQRVVQQFRLQKYLEPTATSSIQDVSVGLSNYVSTFLVSAVNINSDKFQVTARFQSPHTKSDTNDKRSRGSRCPSVQPVSQSHVEPAEETSSHSTHAPISKHSLTNGRCPFRPPTSGVTNV